MSNESILALNPYFLSGDEKKEAIKKLQHFVAVSENPHKTYKALGFLQDEAERKEKKYHIVKNLHSAQRHKMVSEALETFKATEKMKFMKEHKADIDAKNYTVELLHGLEKLEKMEKNSCYHINGLTVTQKDCNTCEHKNTCWRVK